MIISFITPKGGSGKSTNSIHFAGVSALAGYSTLLIDTDQDGTSSAWFTRREEEFENLNVIELSDSVAFKKNMRNFIGRYEVIVIDGAPGHGEHITSVSWVSDLVVIPVNPSPNDVWKLAKTVQHLYDVQDLREDAEKPGPKVFFLMNEVERQDSPLYKETIETLEQYEFGVLGSELRNRASYPQAIKFGLCISEYGPGHLAKVEYRALFDELMGHYEWEEE